MADYELQQAIGLIKGGNNDEAVPILKSILKTDRNIERMVISIIDSMEHKKAYETVVE